MTLACLCAEVLCGFVLLYISCCVCAENKALFWFSRHISLWGSISFYLACLVNIAVAVFYPFGDDGDEGKNFRLFFFSFVLQQMISFGLFFCFCFFYFKVGDRTWGFVHPVIANNNDILDINLRKVGVSRVEMTTPDVRLVPALHSVCL